MSKAENLRTTWIFGSGGHAKVAIDIFRTMGITVMGLFDDDPVKKAMNIGAAAVLGPIPARSDLLPSTAPVFLAIGSNATRKALAAREGFTWSRALHSTAWISPSATMGEGVMLGAAAVVQADAIVGAHAIINTGAILEHDISVGAFCHVAPGVCMGGGASVGEGAFIGTGATILPGVHVGAWSVVGAGAVVTFDVPDNATVMGIPARAKN